MRIAHTRHELWHFLAELKQARPGPVGFVPTMGALHHGHIQLVQKSAQACAVTVSSVFVNRLQFNAEEDFDKYPRTLGSDAGMLEEAGCHLVFAPEHKEMYPQKVLTGFDFGQLERVLEGAKRPGHFSGVGVVVSKLFHLVRPDVAYFGLKDLQQVAVIRQLVRDFDFPMHIEACPTVREANGLAMSSRNQRLSEDGKERAASIYRALQAVAATLPKKSPQLSLREGNAVLSREPSLTTEYLDVVDPDTFEILSDTGRLLKNRKLAVCFAGYLEGVRLIDNVVV